MTIHTLLGITTDFSLGQSVIPAESVADIAARLGQKHVAVADTMTISGLIDIAKATKKVGIDLHLGVRLRIVDQPDVHDKDLKNKGAYYVKAYPKNADGMKEIYKLLTRSHAEDRFYYVPRLSLDDVLDTLTPDNIVLTTGDSEGLFSRPDYQALYDRLAKRFGRDLFVELIPVPQPYFERLSMNALETALAYNAQTIVAFPTHFDDGHYDAFEMNMSIHNKASVMRSYSMRKPWFKEFTPQTQDGLIDMVKRTIAGIRIASPNIDVTGFSQALRTGNNEFLAATSFRWEKQPVALPRLAADPDAELIVQCKAGMSARLQSVVFGYQPTLDQIRQEYLPRLKYELGVLKDLGFADYFLVVADLVKWAKSEGIMVGPGRGSVGGSLVAFLMGITDIDPIRFGLLFERFINPSRNDLPDADLDFMSSRREEVIRYLEDKYSQTHVAGITNYGVLQAASAIKDVGRVLCVSSENLGVTKSIPKEHGQPVSLEKALEEVGEVQRFAATQPKLWRQAVAIQGVMRSYGRHAAGVIVSGVPLVERAVVERDKDGRKVNWDMRVVEDQGLVKMDILGLSTLDTLDLAVKYIRQRHGGKRIDLMSIPLDDEKTLQAFSQGQTIGVFQFEGGAARKILKEMAQTSDLTFNDLVAANALNRPGPIDAGLVQDYVDARNGNRTIAVQHPNMADALKETFNVIVYQEQVMKIAVDLCGFTLSEADKLRKAMGKKDKVLMATFRQQFVEGAQSHSGMTDVIAGELFDQIEVFAGYAFNKSHAAEYSLISYQAMWLKQHYPVEFYAAALSIVDEAKLSVLVADAKVSGIEVRPPDINLSTNEFEIINDTSLVIPFNRIKGISSNTGNAILTARKDGPFASIDDLTARVERRKCNVLAVGRLNLVGAFARIEPGQLDALHESRRKDQWELLPGLIAAVVSADRDIPRDKFTLARIMEMIKEIEDINNKPDGTPKDPSEQVVHVKPVMGKTPRMMVVADCAQRTEEMAKVFTAGESFQYTSGALVAAQLTRQDGYWTGLVKKRKVGKTLTQSDIKTYAPFLDREVELLKPPLIVTMGSAAMRHFIPDIKGSIDEHIGRIFWSEKLQAMILIGFNPGMIYHDEDKFDQLANVFDLARSVIKPDT